MKKIPKAPKFSLALIGPGIVLIAMGLGSGEFILWPYLVAEFGFGIIWGAFIGVTTQYFVSNESGRYTLATGGSIYSAFIKLNKYIPHWFIISTFASFAWPGIILSGGTIFAYMFNIADPRIPTIVMLIIIGLLLTFSGKVYSNLERLQKLFVGIALPILIVISIIIIDAETVSSLASGFAGIGEGYFFVPGTISLMAFLGTIAYSGAAGNLVLSHSFYVQDEGLGMAKGLDTQIDRKKSRKVIPEGEMPEETEENVKNFKDWFKLTSKEQLISFWFVGLLTIILLTLIAYTLTYPFSGEEGLDFVFLQGEALSNQFGAIVGVFFLATGITFLFTTQLGVFETTSRIMTENIQLASQKIKNRYSRENIYFTVLWAQVIAGIIVTLLNLQQPIQLLVLQTFFSALSMFVLSGLVYWLNNSRHIPKLMQPGWFRNLMLISSTLFFGAFVILTVIDLL
jgi:hypothetical protein